jgi:flagellar biosynthesis/type III secretory pathway protein FliH
VDAEEKKSSYNSTPRMHQSRPTGIGLHNFPDIAGEDQGNQQRCLPSEGNFQRIQYQNAGSSCANLASGTDGKGGGSAKRSLSTAQLNEQAYQKGFTEGKIKGMIDAENTWHELAAKKLEPLTNGLQEAMRQLENIRKETYRKIEKELVTLSLAIAKQVICREIAIDREIVLSVAREALAKVEDPGRIKIKMSSSDLQFVKENQPQFSNLVDNMENLTLEAAESVQSGGCIIETDMGEIDARIEKQLQAVEETFRAAMEKA